MDFLIEFALELLIDGGTEVIGNKKLPKVVRFTLFVLIAIFYIFVIGVFLILGVIVYKEKALIGIILILFALFLTMVTVIKLKKAIRNHR